MRASRLRALVLAAGLGTRLKPLTDTTPKPLLPVAGLPILGHTLAALAAAGCEAAAVNLHHLGEPIRSRFGAEFAGMPLVYSEEPEILGTLGALHPLREFLAAAEVVLLVNGDSLCRWPIARLVRRHLADPRRPLATLLLARDADPAGFGGGVGVDREGRILSLRRGDPEAGEVARRHVFAGAHALSPALLERIGPGRADIVADLYRPMLAAGEPLGSLVAAGRWHDLGTPQRFLDGTLDWARAGWPERLWRRSWIAEEAALGPGARVRLSAVEAGSWIGRKARLERCVLLPGARVGEGSFLRDAILGFGATVPAGSWIERRIVTAQGEGPPRADASVVGGAVYTPFEPGSETG